MIEVIKADTRMGHRICPVHCYVEFHDDPESDTKPSSEDFVEIARLAVINGGLFKDPEFYGVLGTVLRDSLDFEDDDLYDDDTIRDMIERMPPSGYWFEHYDRLEPEKLVYVDYEGHTFPVLVCSYIEK